ncbi:MAG: hypothetical protein KatS3mg097_593 [Candidatus Parcubacteria bacterium]|nr:MAG: hypothetical protein KatS3mg097_593 [Candidatus Parcubacteria bacterium]
MIYINDYLFVLKNIVFKDIIDILISSTVITLVIYFFLKLHINKIVITFLLIIGLYVLSINLGLNISLTLLQEIINIIPIVLIVIFQKELRNFFELIAIYFKISKHKDFSYEKQKIILDILKAIQYLSKNKIGAIVVLENKIDLENYLEHKIALNSQVNKEIILSIFNKSSPLHDGAIIINNSTIKWAAAHLPLGQIIDNEKFTATRHRAAIGITEISDAISIIISETNGNISLASNGRIDYDVSLNKIEKTLKEYYNLHEKRKLTKILNNINILKLTLIFFITLMFTLSFWAISNYDNAKIQKSIEIPVEFKGLKDEYAIQSPSTFKTIVILSGYNSDFKFLDESKLKTIIDLFNLDEGNYSIDINKNNIINLPKNIEIVEIKPNTVKFKIVKK